MAGLLLLTLMLADETPEQLRAQQRTDEPALEIVNVIAVEPQVHGAAEGQICGLVGQPLLLEVDVVNRAGFAVVPKYIKIEGEGFRPHAVQKVQEFHETLPSFLEPSRNRYQIDHDNREPTVWEKIKYPGGSACHLKDWPRELPPGAKLAFTVAVRVPAGEGDHKATLILRYDGGPFQKVSKQLVIKTVSTAIMPARLLAESSFRPREQFVDYKPMTDPVNGALRSEIVGRDSSVLGYSVFMGTRDTREAALSIHTMEEDGILIDDVKVGELPGSEIACEIVSGLVAPESSKEEKENEARVRKVGDMLTFDLPQEWLAQEQWKDVVVRLETKGAARGIHQLPVVLKYRNAKSGAAGESRSSIRIGVYDIRRAESKNADGMKWEMTTPEGARIALETTKRPETGALSLPGTLNQEKAVETAKQLVLDTMRDTQIEIQWETEELAKSESCLADRKRTALLSLGLRMLGKHLCGAIVNDAACMAAHRANVNPYAAILAGGVVCELAELYAAVWFAQASKEGATRLMPHTFAGKPLPLPVPARPLKCEFRSASLDTTLRNTRNALKKQEKLDLHAIVGDGKEKKLLSLTPTQLKGGELVFELDLDDLRKTKELQRAELNAGILLWEEKGGVYACEVHTFAKTARFWLHGVANGKYLVGTAITWRGMDGRETRLGPAAVVEVCAAEEGKVTMPGPESLWLGEDELRLMNDDTFFQKRTTRVSTEGGKARYEQIQTGKFYEKDELALDFSITAVSIDKERNTTKMRIGAKPVKAQDRRASVTVRTLLCGEKVGEYEAGTISLGEPATVETELRGVLGVEFDAVQICATSNPATVLTWIGGIVAKEAVKSLIKLVVNRLLDARFGPEVTLEIGVSQGLPGWIEIGQIICPVWQFKMAVSGYKEWIDHRYRIFLASLGADEVRSAFSKMHPGPGETKIEFSVTGGKKETRFSPTNDHEVYYKTYHALSALDDCGDKEMKVRAKLTGYLAVYVGDEYCRTNPDSPGGCADCREPEPGHIGYSYVTKWVKVETISKEITILVSCCFCDWELELGSKSAEHVWSSSGTVTCGFQNLPIPSILLSSRNVKLEELKIAADETSLSPSSWQGIVIQQNAWWDGQFTAAHTGDSGSRGHPLMRSSAVFPCLSVASDGKVAQVS